MFMAPQAKGAQGFDAAVQSLLSPGGVFTCDRPEFNLRQQATFSDEYSRYEFTGVMQMPTPAFGYSLELRRDDFNERDYTFYFIEPEDPLDDLVTDLPIEYGFIGKKGLETFTIKLHDPPDTLLYEKITCERRS